MSDRYRRFPEGFFSRMDPEPDRDFYRQPRLVTHIDDGAISSVGTIYRELSIGGRVLDLMSSWISHFDEPPAALVVAGINGTELAANDAATGAVSVVASASPRAAEYACRCTTLPLHHIHIFHINRATIAEETDQNGKPDSSLRGCHRQHQKSEDLTDEVTEESGKSYQVDVHGEQEELDRHQDNDDVFPVQKDPEHSDREQDRCYRKVV